MIITSFEARELVKHADKPLIKVSLDLGRTTSTVKTKDDFFVFPDGQKINKQMMAKASADDKTCFLIEDNQLLKVQFFGEDTGKFYKLSPSSPGKPPTARISAIPMHVTVEFDPKEDTKRKIGCIGPVKGRVLDTCFGLGYTAILASKKAKSVVTFEKDANMLELAKSNPWSDEAFRSANIEIRNEDVFDAIKTIGDDTFDRVIHDPPTLAFASNLYSEEFYAELFRVMRKGALIYHYVGFPGKKYRGKDLIKSVVKRMKTVGFRDVEERHRGVVAKKL